MKKIYERIGKRGWMPFWWGRKYRKRLCSKRLRHYYNKEINKAEDKDVEFN